MGTAIARASDVKSRPISVALGAAGSQHIIPPVAGYRIAVLGLHVMLNAAVTVTIEQTDGVNLTGGMTPAQYGAVHLENGANPWFTTAVGTGVALTVSAAATGGGVVVYQEVP